MFLNTMRCRALVPSGDGFASKDHLSVFEFADKIEIGAFVVHPGLFPFSRARVENGDALAAQMHGVGAGEIFLDDAAFENSLDAVRPVISLAPTISWPGQVPFADPELELLLLRLRAGLGLRRRIVLPGASQAGQDRRQQPAGSALTGSPGISLPSDGGRTKTVARRDRATQLSPLNQPLW